MPLLWATGAEMVLALRTREPGVKTASQLIAWPRSEAPDLIEAAPPIRAGYALEEQAQQQQDEERERAVQRVIYGDVRQKQVEHASLLLWL